MNEFGTETQAPELDRASAFLTTQWTRVLAARGESPEARQALSDLCAAYYEPVVTFVRRSGYAEDPARDLAHGFFAALLGRHGVEGVNPGQGRFRSYLLGAVKHFLANHRAMGRREKRGAGAAHELIAVALSPESDTSAAAELEVPDSSGLPADAVFDREWALRVLDRAFVILGREFGDAGKNEVYQTLKPWLSGDQPDRSQADAAQQLGMSDGAVRVAIYRLRKRFRDLVKAEINQTVERAADVDEELSHLIAALSSPAS